MEVGKSVLHQQFDGFCDISLASGRGAYPVPYLKVAHFPTLWSQTTVSNIPMHRTVPKPNRQILAEHPLSHPANNQISAFFDGLVGIGKRLPGSKMLTRLGNG